MAKSRQALIGELGQAMQAYQRSTQAFDDEVGRVLGLEPGRPALPRLADRGSDVGARLAEATGLSAAATTSMIDRLERKGFVRRRKHDTDRRQVIVEMTEDGQARTWAMYGPLVEAGMPLLDSSTRPTSRHARPPRRDPRDRPTLTRDRSRDGGSHARLTDGAAIARVYDAPHHRRPPWTPCSTCSPRPSPRTATRPR